MRVFGSTVPDFRKEMRPPPGLCRRCLCGSMFVRVQGYCFFLIFNDRDFLKNSYSRSEHSVDHPYRAWLLVGLLFGLLISSPNSSFVHNQCLPPRYAVFLGMVLFTNFFCFTREHLEFCRGHHWTSLFPSVVSAPPFRRRLPPFPQVWIHDYQLMLVPGLLRDKFPSLSIGFFLHIPSPGATGTHPSVSHLFS